jgi:hypothetical protein
MEVKMVTKELKQYWMKLFNHPLCTEELIDIVRKDIKASVEFGADEYFYTRNKLMHTLDVLETAETLSNYGGKDG